MVRVPTTYHHSLLDNTLRKKERKRKKSGVVGGWDSERGRGA